MGHVLISALQHDRVPGVEVSTPECPIDIHDYPEAVAWAQAQGWGPDPAELIYVADADAQISPGYPTYQLG